MNFNDRLHRLEAAIGADAEPFADPCYAVELHREILERPAVPLPPLEGVDLDATAEHWARERTADGREFVMTDGSTADAGELFRRAGVTR